MAIKSKVAPTYITTLDIVQEWSSMMISSSKISNCAKYTLRMQENFYKTVQNFLSFNS